MRRTMRQRNRGNLREKQKGEHEDTVCWWHALPLAAGGSDPSAGVRETSSE